MSKIEVLNQNTIDKIAAGEVVERPSSVVKELVENAIDANATAVTVEIRDGGIKFIRVTDNGCGIAADEIQHAFLRHATSKIRRAEDLLTIESLGFRGEALSSIAAVSQVEFISKEKGALTAVKYCIEGGIEKSREEIGAPDGTTFLARNLFYNTPARAKFLKTAMTEAGYVSSCIESIALSHPEISFQLIVNDQTKLSTDGSGNLLNVIGSVYGLGITKEVTPVQYTDDTISITGYTGRPELARGNRSYEVYFVNGRYVTNKVITKAIEDAYHTFLMQHKFPLSILMITIDTHSVDVNVHPTKKEVRFSNQSAVYDAVHTAIRNALLSQMHILDTDEQEAHRKLQETKEELQRAPEPFEVNRRRQMSVPEEDSDKSQNTAPKNPQDGLPDHRSKEDHSTGNLMMDASRPTAIRESQTLYQAENKQLGLFAPEFLTPQAHTYHRIIGEVFDTYWLVEYNDQLFIMDQHAAHEKVMYENLVEEFRHNKIVTQSINPPVVISVNDQEKARLLQYQEAFTALGFEIESFGGREYCVRTVPMDLLGLNTSQLFMELLDDLDDTGIDPALSSVAKRLAMKSCKAAVKGNQTISEKEADALLENLMKLENPYQCPHGRPTIIKMSKQELEKKFKRIV